MVAVSVEPQAVLGSGQKAAAWGARRLWRGGALRLDSAPGTKFETGG